MGYRLIKQLDIEEIGCTLTQLEHEGCGARIMHLGCEDPENLFCLAFQTLPNRSDGAPHILEHTVLCGSKKYPVKDPFFGMLRRSLNTFMNAMTGDDITFYPAASQVPVDFYNLLDVYVDAVFFPNLQKLSFLQEGHRLEFATADDPESPLQRKGIVFNEMKGAMASAEARWWYRLMKELYPDTPYRFNSGGDPAVIPQLSYEELVDFHRIFYHPSRCLFYFYGNIPLEQHLEYLEQRVLGESEKLPPLPPIPHQPHLKQPLRVEDTYPIAPQEESDGKTMVILGWLTAPITDPEEVLALGVLDLLLTGTDASPLKLALLKSGLCKDAYAFVSGDMADVPFVLACKGCEADADEALSAVVETELKRLVETGFSAELIEAAIHQIEFSRTEIKGDSHPYGLSLFRRSGTLVLLGIDPEIGLRIHTLFDKLRKHMLQPETIPALIQKYLLDNPHQCRLVMRPDPQRGAQEEEAEAEMLAQLKSELTADQVEQTIAQAAELRTFQEKQEGASLDVLPQISMDEVPKAPLSFPLIQHRSGPFKLLQHNCFTNGIVYAGLHFDLPQVAYEELPYLQLMLSMLPELGCGGRNYREQLDYLMAHTGGIGASAGLYAQATDITSFRPALTIAGKALDHKADKLFPLFVDMLTSADFSDRERLTELLIQYYTGMEQALPSQGMRYATSLATEALSPAARIHEAWQGLRFFKTLRQVAHNLDQELEQLQKQLQQLQQQLLGVGKADLVLSADTEAVARYEASGFYGLLDLPVREAKPWKVPDTVTSVPAQGRIIAAPVAFTCKAIRGLPFHHPDAAALSLAARLFDHKTLHPLVREKGGAYGSGAVSSPGTALFYFYAYRDPHLAQTLDAFELAVRGIAEGQFTEQELEEAKLSFIQRADTPVSPGSRAGVAYGWHREGKKLELRQAFRDRLLAATPHDVTESVAKHLQPAMSTGTVVSFAGEELLKRENSALKEPLEILTI